MPYVIGSVPHLCDVRKLFVEPLTAQQLAAVGEAMTGLRTHLGSALSPTTKSD